MQSLALNGSVPIPFSFWILYHGSQCTSLVSSSPWAMFAPWWFIHSWDEYTICLEDLCWHLRWYRTQFTGFPRGPDVLAFISHSGYHISLHLVRYFYTSLSTVLSILAYNLEFLLNLLLVTLYFTILQKWLFYKFSIWVRNTIKNGFFSWWFCYSELC